MKYAKMGQVHPESDLAVRAYRWAKGETEFNIFRGTRAGLWAVLASCWLPGLSQAVFKLRVARRIVEVSERQMAVIAEQNEDLQAMNQSGVPLTVLKVLTAIDVVGILARSCCAVTKIWLGRPRLLLSPPMRHDPGG